MSEFITVNTLNFMELRLMIALRIFILCLLFILIAGVQCGGRYNQSPQQYSLNDHSHHIYSIAVTDMIATPANVQNNILDEFRDILIEKLVDNGRFRVVERQLLESALVELHFNMSDLVDPTTAQRLGKFIGAEYIIVGTYYSWADATRLSSRVIRTETAEIIAAKSIRGNLSNVAGAFDVLSNQLIEKIQRRLINQ